MQDRSNDYDNHKFHSDRVMFITNYVTVLPCHYGKYYGQ